MITLNFANPDMVGHSGVFNATIKAVETVDRCLGEIFDELDKMNGTLLVTADHGNAEAKVDLETDLPLTAHSTNAVPFLFLTKLINLSVNVVTNNNKVARLKSGGLANLSLCQPCEPS